MTSMDSIIETGVDKLVELIKARGRISFADAALQLGVSVTVIEEWANFLEEEGIISIEYKLTTPYLVERKLTQAEVVTKAKEFTGQKDIFIRKAEVALNFLDRQAGQLRNIKGEFDKLKKDLGLKVDEVKDELKELERYEQLKNTIDKQILEQKKLMESRFTQMNDQIAKEQKRYEHLLAEIQLEEKRLGFEKEQFHTLEEGELVLQRRLNELKDTVKDLQNRINEEGSIIGQSKSHVEKLKYLAHKVEDSVEKDNEYVDLLKQKQQENFQKLLKVQDEVMRKISTHTSSSTQASQLTNKFQTYFKSKLHAFDVIDKLNLDRDELEKEMLDLLRKAKAFQLGTGIKDNEKIVELEKRFKTVDEKKKHFEGELNEFNQLMESAA